MMLNTQVMVRNPTYGDSWPTTWTSGGFAVIAVCDEDVSSFIRERVSTPENGNLS